MSDRSYILQELIKDLPDGSRDYILRNSALAQGYAWGFQDCQAMNNASHELQLVIRDARDATQFSYEYGIHVARFVRKEHHTHTSILYAYGAWCDGLTDESKWG